MILASHHGSHESKCCYQDNSASIAIMSPEMALSSYYYNKNKVTLTAVIRTGDFSFKVKFHQWDNSLLVDDALIHDSKSS